MNPEYQSSDNNGPLRQILEDKASGHDTLVHGEVFARPALSRKGNCFFLPRVIRFYPVSQYHGLFLQLYWFKRHVMVISSVFYLFFFILLSCDTYTVSPPSTTPSLSTTSPLPQSRPPRNINQTCHSKLQKVQIQLKGKTGDRASFCNFGVPVLHASFLPKRSLLSDKILLLLI